jgi:raffinose/stachyose/melibiose transport system permease protein
VTLFLTLINSFKQFDVNFALTDGGPSTQVAGLSIWGTTLISMYILDTYQVSLNPALAQAQAVVFFVILTLISLAQVTYNKRKEVEA